MESSLSSLPSHQNRQAGVSKTVGDSTSAENEEEERSDLNASGQKDKALTKAGEDYADSANEAFSSSSSEMPRKHVKDEENEKEEAIKNSMHADDLDDDNEKEE